MGRRGQVRAKIEGLQRLGAGRQVCYDLCHILNI